MRKFLLLFCLSTCLASFAGEYDSDFNSIITELTLIQGALERVEDNLGGSDTATIYDALSTASTHLYNMRSMLSNVEQYTLAIMRDVDSTDTNVGNIYNRLGQILTYQGTIDMSLNNVETYCNTLANSVPQVLADYDTIIGYLSSVADELSDYKSNINSYFTGVFEEFTYLRNSVNHIADIFESWTNQATGVVYDFSKLTNGFNNISGVYLTRTNFGVVPNVMSWFYGDLVRPNSFTVNTGTLNISSRNLNSLSYANLGTYLNYIFRSIDSFNSLWGPQYNKSFITQTFTQLKLTNDVGRLVIQGNLLTNRVDSISKNVFWISNYLDTVLFSTQTQLTNDTARMLLILEQLTNQHFSVSVQQKEEIQKGVDYSTETADSIEKPEELTAQTITGLQFDLSNVKAFVDSIPTYDSLPARLFFSFTDEKGGLVQWEADVEPYSVVCTAIRALFSVFIYGVVLTLLIVGVKWVFRLLIFIAQLIPSVDKV